MRVVLSTHGCRLNQAESDAMEANLQGAGHEVVSALADADWWVLNSCTITHQADADARQAIRRTKRENPGVRILVTGCYANADAGRLSAMPEVDAVLGNADKDRLAEVLGRAAPARGAEGYVCVSALTRRLPALRAARGRGRTRALVKVQDGCNYRCSFCIVPAVRGPSRSLEVEAILEQVAELVAQGVPEIVLTGIHLGTWGRDLRPRCTLTALIQALLPALGPARLRLGSLDPHEVDRSLIELMAAHPRELCRHLHLPVQSGDPEILRSMRRGHSAHDFVALCETLLDRVPGIAIGTDLIVGFPGETEAAFGQTEAMLAALPLAYHHVFTYSKRQGTAAAGMHGHVEEQSKQLRGRRLRALSRRQAKAFAASFAGRTLDAVLEPQREGGFIALTDNFLRLPARGEAALARRRVRVTVGADGRSATIAS